MNFQKTLPRGRILPPLFVGRRLHSAVRFAAYIPVVPLSGLWSTDNFVFFLSSLPVKGRVQQLAPAVATPPPISRGAGHFFRVLFGPPLPGGEAGESAFDV
jgi:hypothetical protein